MAWDRDAIELIKKRESVRSYGPKPVPVESLAAFEAFLAAAGGNPFGAQVRLNMVNAAGQKLGTYGFFKGARLFFGGCVKKGGRDIEGFGYAMERAVLFATAQGFGTCWLGGIYQRGKARELLQPDNEYLPAISPIGYPAGKKALIERAVAAGAGARKRKPFGELFFDGNIPSPLALEDGALRTCLEMVRIGPSASNRQPWRMVRQGGACHFYMMVDKRYAGNMLYGFCMQRLDMGIAACHFELAARQTGLAGGVVFDDPGLLTARQTEQGLRYSFSWR